MNKLLKIFLIFSALGVLLLGSFMVRNSDGEISLSQTLNPSPPPTLSAEKLMSIVNDWRYSQGFQPFTKNADVCSLATIRVNEIQNDYSHNGFEQRVKDKSFGFYYLDLGENLAHAYPTEQSTLDSWLNSPSHLANLQKNYEYSCIQCQNSYCVQIFANF